ncbi:MAG: aldehyde dehydrogenase family protein [Blastocatellia bacterium]
MNYLATCRSRIKRYCDCAEGKLPTLRVRPEPLGVILVLAPWNYPWLASVNAIVPALLASNSVILKIAPQTPLVAERYAEALPPGCR